MRLPSSPPASARLLPPEQRRIAAWTLATLALLVLWDFLGQDRLLARAFGSASGFPLRDQWFFVHVAHEGARRVGWLLVLLLALGVWWPMGPLRRLDTGERLQWVVSTLLALAVVGLAKNLSSTSCPWDMAEFGGVARYASHWAWGLADGGSGRCFPAGHASAGFAFLSGWFALRRAQPRAAWACLAASLLAGLLLGLAQQARGAHFMSHTLWSGWLCWTTAWICDLAARLLRRRMAVRTGAVAPAAP